MQRDHGLSRAWVAPRDRPLLVLRRGWSLLRTEGPGGLLRGIGRFSAALRLHAYMQRYMRVYCLCLDNAVLVPATPPFEGIELHIVESRDDVLTLARQGYENLLEVVPNMQRCMDTGAVAACAFVGTEFASIDWIALSDAAKRVIDPSPYPAHLEEGEACTGGAFTLRRFRRRGIAAYRFSAQVRYLHERGVRVCYNTIAVENVPSQRCVERYGATYDRVFRQRRILGRSRYWTLTMPFPRDG